MSNVFLVDWYSKGNIERGTVVVAAETIVEAQDKFLDWIRKQALYNHMWHLDFSIEKATMAE